MSTPLYRDFVNLIRVGFLAKLQHTRSLINLSGITVLSRVKFLVLLPGDDNNLKFYV